MVTPAMGVSQRQVRCLLRRQIIEIVAHLPKVSAIYGEVVVADYLIARMNFRLGISSGPYSGDKSIFAVNCHAVAIVHAVWPRGWAEERVRVVQTVEVARYDAKGLAERGCI